MNGIDYFEKKVILLTVNNILYKRDNFLLYACFHVVSYILYTRAGRYCTQQVLYTNEGKHRLDCCVRGISLMQLRSVDGMWPIKTEAYQQALNTGCGVTYIYINA